MCLVREGGGDTYFILQKVWSTHTQLCILLSSVASEKEDVGRVGLMALVLRAPASTRDPGALSSIVIHNYSRLVRGARIQVGQPRATTLFYYSAVPRKDRTCDGRR